MLLARDAALHGVLNAVEAVDVCARKVHLFLEVLAAIVHAVHHPHERAKPHEGEGSEDEKKLRATQAARRHQRLGRRRLKVGHRRGAIVCGIAVHQDGI
eukprot:jgi/Chrpa1/3901/Chrysochromulina_OHIO_Genome00007197-RA